MRMLFLVFSIGLVAWGAGSAALAAGSVRIESGSDRSVTVVADGATLAEIVGKLSETYGFRLEQKTTSRKDDRGGDKNGDEAFGVDGRYEGSLRVVLDRLLAKESYFIEHATGSKSGIARVVLYSAGNATASKSAASQGQMFNRAANIPAMAPPATPIATPQALVPPIRRVQPVQPTLAAPSAVRPGAVASPRPIQVTPGQTAAAGIATTPTPPRKRGGLIQ